MSLTTLLNTKNQPCLLSIDLMKFNTQFKGDNYEMQTVQSHVDVEL